MSSVCGSTFEAANGHVTTACQLPVGHDGDCQGLILGSPTRWDRRYATEEESYFGVTAEDRRAAYERYLKSCG